MSIMDSVRRVVGIKNPEEEYNERSLDLQERQLQVSQRVPASETAYASQMTKTADSDLKELGAYALDPDNDIEEFKSQLRGYRIVQIEDRGVIVNRKIVFGTAAMNDDGIEYIAGIMRFYSSKGFTLTNYSGDKGKGLMMIKKMCFIQSIKIAATLATRRWEWKIDPIKRSTISNHLSDYIYACMCRSLDMQTAAKYWNTQKGITHINQQLPAMTDGGPKKSGGIFG